MNTTSNFKTYRLLRQLILVIQWSMYQDHSCIRTFRPMIYTLLLAVSLFDHRPDHNKNDTNRRMKSKILPYKFNKYTHMKPVVMRYDNSVHKPSRLAHYWRVWQSRSSWSGTGYLERFRGIHSPQPVQRYVGTVLQIGHDRFHPHSFWSITCTMLPNFCSW
jgi:hypothetical protein